MKEVTMNPGVSYQGLGNGTGKTQGASTDPGFANLLRGSGADGSKLSQTGKQSVDGQQPDAKRTERPDGTKKDTRSKTEASSKGKGTDRKAAALDAAEEADALKGQSQQEVELLSAMLGFQGQTMAEVKEDLAVEPEVEAVPQPEVSTKVPLASFSFSEALPKDGQNVAAEEAAGLTGEVASIVQAVPTAVETTPLVSIVPAEEDGAEESTEEPLEETASTETVSRSIQMSLDDPPPMRGLAVGTGRFFQNAPQVIRQDAGGRPEPLSQVSSVIANTEQAPQQADNAVLSQADAPLQTQMVRAEEDVRIDQGGKAERSETEGREVPVQEEGTERLSDAQEAPVRAFKQKDTSQEDGAKASEGEGREAAWTDLAARQFAATDTQGVQGKETFFSQTAQGTMRTTEARLPEDVTNLVASRMGRQNRELVIELEPRDLGQITLRLSYEGGRANLSILASNPRTLDLLSTHAGEMARILEQKTGNQTVVFVPRQENPQQGEDMQHRQGQSDNEQNAERRWAEQNEERRQKGQSEAFLQQMRLGLL